MTTARVASAAVVVNPAGAGADLREPVAEAIDRLGTRAEWYETTPDDPGTGQTRAALDAGADVVIACGGDGTVRACAEALARTGVPLGIVPAGTGNLLARNLAIPRKPAEAVAAALTGPRRRLDLGRVNGEAFAVMAGVGFDARMIADAPRDWKNRLGSLAYVASAVRHLRDPNDPMRVTVDGEPTASGYFTSVLVGNVGKVQADLPVFPDADPADGRLDLLWVQVDGLWDWLAAAWAVLVGRKDPRVDRSRANEIVVELGRPVPYEIDGEERPETTRLEFGIEPQALVVATAGDPR